MEQFIGCDAHKKFSVFVTLNECGEYGPAIRVGHERKGFRAYLKQLPPGSQIALETSGFYYWMVDEMEGAGHVPRLAHARTAKRRMEGRHKTDARDARGLAMLLCNGTLPQVWIPPAGMRDQRELLRWRMCLSRMRARVKNRIHGALQRYNVDVTVSDLFGDEGRAQMLARLDELPPHSRASVLDQLNLVDSLETEIAAREVEIQEMLYPSVERDLLDTLPCVGPLLSAVLALEIGAVRRFPGPAWLASYAGLVPVARESAGWRKQEGCPRDCNVYLKWAYVEAANLIAAHRRHWPERHVVRLYERVRVKTRMHGKAALAVARHLAEASWHMLSKLEVYREPCPRRPALSSTHG